MCDTSSITIGTIVIVKLACNEIEVVVTEIGDNRWKVKKVGSDKEFYVYQIQRVVSDPGSIPTITAEMEDEEDDTPNPAPEREGQPEKRLSLTNAAIKILEASETPLNTRELVTKAIESGLWVSNGSKTPEQSLYSAFFREIKESQTPRIRKSTTRKEIGRAHV